jgi:acyl-CoA synthetase (AMP-forming)/AMP-acid ligase II
MKPTSPATATTLVEILRYRADRAGDERAYGSWGDEDVEGWMTWRAVDERARAIAAALMETSAPGDRALLVFEPGFDFIAAFFGCLYANVVAVPVYPPEPTRLDRTLPRWSAIVADARATVALTTGQLQRLTGDLVATAPVLASLRWLAVDALDGGEWHDQPRTGETVAFLQYTSGSTGAPKGVVVSHGNLLHNSAAIQRALGSSSESIKVSWVPPYHDMGLVGCIVQAAYVGFPLVSMSPMAFLLRPLRWLQAMSRTGATLSGAPNFALDLCVQKIGPAERASLDLSHWRSLYVSAEPVQKSTLERFARCFAECGFSPRALYPTYGLAEATLVATGGVHGSGFRALEREGRSFVSVGAPITDGGEMAIVHPESGARLADGEIGEVWLRSRSNALGYWSRAQATQDTFAARLGEGAPWLRTGDLGFVRDGELYLTGRLKEVIIIRGRKHFPTDLEETVDHVNWEMPHHRAGGSAAVALTIDGEERLGLAVEIERRMRERRTAAPRPVEDRRRGRDRRARAFKYKPLNEPQPLDFESVVRQFCVAVAAAHGVEPFAIVLLRPGAIPKTSSGKKQRLKCREMYFAGESPRDVLHAWRADEARSQLG